MATIYYDSDADFDLLKERVVSVIGYGSQGHAQALNLKESGANVIVGLRPSSKSVDEAKANGLTVKSVEEAAAEGDIVQILIPDELQGSVYKKTRLNPICQMAICFCFRTDSVSTLDKLHLQKE